jgi:hypothetical protein
MNETVTKKDDISGVIKFTDEELTEAKFILQKYQEKTVKLGQLSLDRFVIEDRLSRIKEIENSLKEEFIEIQKIERSFLDTVTGKYGEGALDIANGTFIPQKAS